MNKNRVRNYIIAYLIMVLLLLILVVLNICTGSIETSLRDTINILSGRDDSEVLVKIIYTIRFPRIVAAIILGGALAVSGLLLQIFFHNPIAGPYVLGISSGAKLTVALAMIFMLGRGLGISAIGMIIAAFLGSMLATGFILLISLRTRKMSVLIICGILIGYICSAITDFCVTFANDANIVNLHNWSLGSLSGMTWGSVVVMTIVVIISLFIAILLSKQIGAYGLGETYARGLGVNIKLLRVLIIVISSVLSACVTAFAGPISFVGIAVPHMVKTMTKTSKPIILIPACFLGGAIVTLLCDGIARTMFAPTELSISSVTAILLVPVVIFMMLKRSEDRSDGITKN